jgi:hypothetical protein
MLRFSSVPFSFLNNPTILTAQHRQFGVLQCALLLVLERNEHLCCGQIMGHYAPRGDMRNWGRIAAVTVLYLP